MKVAIYCRLSEEDKNKQIETDDSSGIQNQKAMPVQFIHDLENPHKYCFFEAYRSHRKLQLLTTYWFLHDC